MPVNQTELKELIDLICAEKGLESSEVIKAIEVAIASAYRKEYGRKENAYVAEFDANTGRYNLYQTQTIVEEVINPAQQLTLVDARLSNPTAQIDDVIKTSVNVDSEVEFGRIASQIAKQVLSQSIYNVRHSKLLSQFKEKIGDVVNVEIDYFQRGGYHVKLGQTTGFLSRENLLPIDKFKSGTVVKALIADLQEDAKGNTRIILSRSHPDFVAAILKHEIPEVANGLITIHKVVREPGVRSKILVGNTEGEEDIDPVGAILGKKNMRIVNVMRQITTTMMEKIDVIEYQPGETDLMIMDALEPAQIDRVAVHSEEGKADVYCYKDEAALAVGKRGVNIKLAQELLGLELNIITVEEEDKSEVIDNAPSIILE
jgi:transcription termination/antitermination protein NusA